MDRRTFLTMASGGLLAAPLAAEAQQPGKVWRIGYLGITPLNPTGEAFLQGLRDHGWGEGQNLAIERRYSEGRDERFRDLAADLVRLKVEVIVTVGTPATLAAKQATDTIPIVMVAVGDPVGSGFVASLGLPGGNITGLSFLAGELEGKRFELLKVAVLNLSRVAVLWNPGNPDSALSLKHIQVAAEVLGIKVQPLEVRSGRDLDGAFATMGRERPDGLIVPAEAVLFVNRAQIVDFAAQHRLPAVYGSRQFVEAGGLMAYAANIVDLFRRAPTCVDKILKGARPADLPVEQPTRFELLINLKTAKALGLTIPQSLLDRADQVIE